MVHPIFRQENLYRGVKGSSKNAYAPAELEAYVLRNAEALGYNIPFAGYDPLSGHGQSEFFKGLTSANRKAFMNARNVTSGCEIWLNKTNPMYETANAFKRELKQ